MRLEYLDNKLPPLVQDYIGERENLKQFYCFEPNYAGLSKATDNRVFPEDNREILVNALSEQYNLVETSEKTSQNIQKLRNSNCFTVTTGHQLSLFTGPLYFIYKILSTIKLAEELNKKHADKHFVPVYWMASEDHDFEEINHFKLFNQTHTWESNQKGAVGEFETTQIASIFEKIKEDLPSFKRAYLHHKNLSEATFYLVNDLFKEYGLVVLEPNKRELKKLFSAWMKDDLISSKNYQPVNQTSDKLKALGYKAQVNPREINLFHLGRNSRERIVKDGNKYTVLNSKLSFSENELLSELDDQPETFSPNVILRPLFQETILPNIAYVGGPSEISYWLQLKANFGQNKVFFPTLILRDSFLVLDKPTQKTIEKLELNLSELFAEYHVLKKALIHKWSASNTSLIKEEKQIESALESIKDKTHDKGLHASIDAEIKKIQKNIKGFETKLRKAEERNHETSLNKLKKLKESLFPHGEPQERSENVLNFLINDDAFISKIYDGCNPLDARLKVVFL